MHGIIYRYGERTFENTWPINNTRLVPHNLCNTKDLIIPHPHFEGFKRYPLYDFAKSWNELGLMKLQENQTTFKIWHYDEMFRQISPE